MRRRPCCGCEEQRGTINVEHLGWVCEFCFEVVDIVFEVELERVREASRAVRAFINDVATHACVTKGGSRTRAWNSHESRQKTGQNRAHLLPVTVVTGAKIPPFFGR